MKLLDAETMAVMATQQPAGKHKQVPRKENKYQKEQPSDKNKCYNINDYRST